MKDLTKTPLIDLLDMIDIYSSIGDQESVNKIALEIARRWWYEGFGKTKKEFLKEFGYKEIKNNGGKVKKK